MTEVERLAAFVQRAAYDDIPDSAREQLRIRILDSLGCAIGALEGEPVAMLRELVGDLDLGATDVRVWIEGLPPTPGSGTRLLDELSR